MEIINLLKGFFEYVIQIQQVKIHLVLLLVLIICCAAPPCPAQTNYAGMRVSRLPFSPFPEPVYFTSVSNRLASQIDNGQPCLIWIVSIYQGDGKTRFNFPRPPGLDDLDSRILFRSTEQNESFLDAFDRKGVKVWLQVEPGDADVIQQIEIVLDRYGHHPCVIGFGVDVEWYNTSIVSNGGPVSDESAQAWDQKIKSYNPDYRLFLKHYLQSRMPPTERGDILFVDDSQDFPSLDRMESEFQSWGRKFSPADVAFQYGYPRDRDWWSSIEDPAKTIAQTLDQSVPNASGFFWVDFTIEELYPEPVQNLGYLITY